MAAIVDEAAEVGYEPLVLRAMLAQGILESETDDDEAAVTTLTKAYKLAVGLEMTVEASSATNELMYVIGTKLGKTEEGWNWAEHAEAWSKAVGTELASGIYLGRRGLLARTEGKYEQAFADSERALEIYEDVYGPAHSEVATVLNTLGGIRYDQDDCAGARSYFASALRIQEAIYGSKHPRSGFMLANLATVSTCLVSSADDASELAQARADFDRALEALTPLFGAEHPNIGQVRLNSALLEIKAGELRIAREHLETTLAIFERGLGADHINTTYPLNHLGRVAEAEGDDPQALAHYERALSIGEAAMGPEHPNLVDSLLGIVDVALRMGDHRRALALQERVLAIHTARPTSPEATAKAHAALAKILWEAPGDQGRDRPRALHLAAQARQRYRDLKDREQVANLEAWIDART